jgi:hypothetical protein
MTLSLTYDHRAIEGAPAARFLERVKQGVERPGSLPVRQVGWHEACDAGASQDLVVEFADSGGAIQQHPLGR